MAPIRRAAISAGTIAAPARATTSVEAVAEPLVEVEAEAELSKLACPICYYPLVSSIDHQSPPSKLDFSLECSTCKKAYAKDHYWDLTVAAGFTEYSEAMPATTELFRTRLVSFLYERGWRETFKWRGFPGVERELRRLTLVRADIFRLPFVSGSIDAVHAGAAIHCWSSPASAVAEISRVLCPGGVFVASTFVADVLPLFLPLLRIGRQYIGPITGINIFLSELELEDLCGACGLVNFTAVRNRSYIMFSATKAS